MSPLNVDMLDLFKDTCTWSKLVSRDGYGNPTFQRQGSTYPCRYTRKNKLVRKKDAQQVLSTAQVSILPSLTSGDPFPLIQDTDQIQLSDGRTPQIASVEIVQDELLDQTEEPSHTVVYCL